MTEVRAAEVPDKAPGPNSNPVRLEIALRADVTGNPFLCEMSQQTGATVMNGPNSDANATAKSVPQPEPRNSPPLNRIDSRSNLSPRPTGFPPGQQFRPQIPNQQQHQQQHHQQQQQRPQFGPQGPAQYPRAQLQRNPSSSGPAPGGPATNPNIRPGTPSPAAQAGGLRQPPPFARPPLSPGGRPPGLFQQKSITRSPTLDSTDSTRNDQKVAEEEVKAQAGAAKPEEAVKAREDVKEETKPDQKAPVPMAPVEEKKEVKEEAKELKVVEEAKELKVVEEAREQRSPTPTKLEASQNKPKIENSSEIKEKEVATKPEPPRSPIEKKEAVVEKKVEKPKTLRPDSRGSTGRSESLKSPSRSEGDNDSGVDESTQGNVSITTTQKGHRISTYTKITPYSYPNDTFRDQSSNGDHNSPRKSSSKPTPRNTASPTKSRSVSRGSKSPHVKTPDSPTPSTPGSVDKKKVPMNKVQVGGAPSPNLKEVKSKIGSLQNASYKPGGGHVKIETKKIDIKAQSKVAAKNDKYVPGGGDKKIEQRKLTWSAHSKIGSLDNTTHKPTGGNKKIETIKLDFKDKAKPKVGSKDNIKYQPGGGDVKIETKKLDIKAKSKINSLDNVKHKPGGGDKKIFDDKDYLRQKSGASGDHNSFNGSQPASPVKEYYSPEVNVISPAQEKVTVVETAEVTKKTENVKEKIKPSPRLTRTASLRSKKNATPRNQNDTSNKAPWRF